ncbi:unnamed protein product [Eruca vesicaria subsp. sativa]|uniref:Uncharacterized protein n=1 Tax=Eruca vesicaria subsp. sativa TaxID=29727 RepID=A0ABC8LIX6_ERUVS|nr:unnamed protein product [Eruca vesicaria subsp. sativa]
MAVPINLLNNSEPSSDEDFSDSELSLTSEDESSEITSAGGETETNHGEGDEFWVRYPYLKIVIDTIVAQGVVPKDYAYERAKLLGDDEAKKLNQEGNALFLMEIEFCKKKIELISSVISKMLSGK